MSDCPSQEVLPDSPLPDGVPLARPIALSSLTDLCTASQNQPIVRPPRVWTIFAICVAVFLVLIVVNAAWLFHAGAFHERSRSTENALETLAKRPEAMISLALWSMVACLAVTLACAFMSPTPWRQRLRLQRPHMSAGQMLFGAVGASCIGIMFSMVYGLGLLPPSTTLEPLGRAVSALMDQHMLRVLLVIGVMPGLAEECLFRGYIQTRLSRRWGGYVAVVITAVLFGVYHMDISQGILALSLGLYLGFLAERARSIIPAMIGHATNNTVGTLISAWSDEIQTPATVIVALILSTILFTVCLAITLRKPAGPPLETTAC